MTLTFVREPKLMTVVPDLICDAEGDRPITLNGADFLTVNNVTPIVHVGARVYVPTVSNCTPITGPGLSETVQQCTTLSITIAKNDFMVSAPTANDVTVTNPPPADCVTHPAVDLEVVPPPVLTAIRPDLVCDAQAMQTFTLEGTGMLSVTSGGTTLTPTVAITQNSTTIAGAPLSATPVMSSCTAVTGPTETVLTCTQMSVTIAASSLPSGVYGFTLTNPPSAGCSTSASLEFRILPPPVVAAVAPLGICNAATGETTVVVNGSDFLIINGATPSADLAPVAGGVATHIPAGKVTPVVSTCTALPALQGSTDVVSTCTRLLVLVPAGAVVGANTYNFTVSNPPPAGCSSSPPVVMGGVAPPTITSINDRLCLGGGTIAIVGANLRSDTFVTVTAAGGGPIPATFDLGVGLHGQRPHAGLHQPRRQLRPAAGQRAAHRVGVSGRPVHQQRHHDRVGRHLGPGRLLRRSAHRLQRRHHLGDRVRGQPRCRHDHRDHVLSRRHQPGRSRRPHLHGRPG